MNRNRPKTPTALLLMLICLGSGAAALSFWLVDHRQAIPASGITIAVSFIVFLASYTGAFFLYLHERDARRAMVVTTVSSKTPIQQNLEGTIYRMIPGTRYQVKQSFTDYYGNSFERNEILRFKERHFLPYEGGHTIVFKERSLYLQEERNQGIVEHFSDYIVQVS
jgi:hypothetical protein